MDAMVCSGFFGFTEYGTIDRVVGEGCGVILCFYYLTETCEEVCEFVFATIFVNMGGSYQRPRSEAADERIRRGECDIREYVPVHYAASSGVRIVIVGNSNAGFNFPNVE